MELTGASALELSGASALDDADEEPPVPPEQPDSASRSASTSASRALSFLFFMFMPPKSYVRVPRPRPVWERTVIPKAASRVFSPPAGGENTEKLFSGPSGLRASALRRDFIIVGKGV